MAKIDTAQVAKAVVTKDQLLANHLQKAEEHLIEAVKLFNNKQSPERPQFYVERLTRAQETVTALFREELVRMRGPIKFAAKAAKRKK